MAERPDIEALLRTYREAGAQTKQEIENAVTEAYAPMVHKIAFRYPSPFREGPSDIQDRIQDGYQGLLQAVRTYDPDRGVKFLTYAFGYVRKAVYCGLRNLNTPGRAKAYTNSRLQKYRKIRSELTTQLGRSPSVRELSLETGWRLNTVLVYERYLKAAEPLDILSFSETAAGAIL